MTEIDLEDEPPFKAEDTPTFGIAAVNGEVEVSETQDLVAVVDTKFRLSPDVRIEVKVISDEPETDQMYNLLFNTFGESGFMVTHGDRYDWDGTPSNQDVVGFSESVIMGGDGISGHRDGLTASELATSAAAAIMEYDESEYALYRAILRANWEVSRLKQAWEPAPPGTTLAGFRRSNTLSPEGFVDIEGICVGDTKVFAIVPSNDGSWSLERVGNSHGFDGYVYEDAKFYASFFRNHHSKGIYDFNEAGVANRFPEPVINSEFNMRLKKEDYLNAINGMRNALMTSDDNQRMDNVKLVVGDLLISELSRIDRLDISTMDLTKFIEYLALNFYQNEATNDSEIEFLHDNEKIFALFRLVHFANLNRIVESIGSLRDRVGGEGLHNFLFNFDEPNFEVDSWINRAREKFIFKKRFPVGTKLVIMSDGGDEIRADRLLQIVADSTPQRAARALHEEFKSTGKTTVIGNDNLFCTVTELQARPGDKLTRDTLIAFASTFMGENMVDKMSA